MLSSQRIGFVNFESVAISSLARVGAVVAESRRTWSRRIRHFFIELIQVIHN